MPRRIKAVAFYSRIAERVQPERLRRKGWVRGGTFLIRFVGRVARRAGLENAVMLDLRGAKIVCDVGDARFGHVIGEVQAVTAEGQLFERLLRPGDTFLDVGANHGSFSVVAARCVSTAGAVIAFEPQPGLAQLLERSLAASTTDTVQVHRVACGEKPGTATLHVPHRHSGSASVHGGTSDNHGHTTFTVPIACIDDLVELDRLPGRVVMKLDVEGNELAALRGAHRLISERHPTIVFELNPTTLARAGHAGHDLLALLGGFGYAFATIVDYPTCMPVDDIDVSISRNLVAMSQAESAGGLRATA